jgi:Zn-dependent peptidase ImmA (M78 family)
MKKPPSSVMIGGIKFRIVIAPLDNGDFGRMLFDEKKILLNTTCLAKASLMRETLRHEMLHAALHMSGVSFSERYDEENVVRAIEHIFFPAWDKLHAKLTSL